MTVGRRRSPKSPSEKGLVALNEKKRSEGYDQLVKISKIKLDDDGSRRYAVILNPERKDYIKRRMDGGHMKQVTAADWMLTKIGVGDLFLELKGSDVAKAIEQIHATAHFARSEKLSGAKIAGLVLCTQHPGISTKIQRLMHAFVKEFKGPIHTRNRSGEFVFERVLSFSGPE